MNTTRALAAQFLVALVLVSSGFAQKKARTASHVPEVGEIARPIGSVSWLELGTGSGRSATDLAALRGKVVIVADYGYYCDSCTRVGIPTLGALRGSNAAADLAVIQLTAAIGEDTAEVIQREGEKLGIAGAVGMTDVEGQGSPYLDMNANGNLTYAYVIGRHGGIVWKGDPSRKREEYVAAVGKALHAVPCAALPADPAAFGPELAPMVRDYVLGDFVKAETGAQALVKKLEKKSGADAERVRGAADALLALVAETRKDLMEELEKSAGEKHAERFTRALLHVRRVFAKGPEVDRAGSLDMYMSIQSDQGPNCKRWSEWYALVEARPATFPAEKDPAGTKYARELAKHVQAEDAFGVDQARAWLEKFEQAKARK